MKLRGVQMVSTVLSPCMTYEKELQGGVRLAHRKYTTLLPARAHRLEADFVG